VMHSDGRIDEIAVKRAQARQCAIFVRARQAAEADYVGGEDCGKFRVSVVAVSLVKTSARSLSNYPDRRYHTTDPPFGSSQGKRYWCNQRVQQSTAF
jgi:hypothetical protein